MTRKKSTLSTRKITFHDKDDMVLVVTLELLTPNNRMTPDEHKTCMKSATRSVVKTITDGQIPYVDFGVDNMKIEENS